MNTKNSQEDIFIKREADAFYERNFSRLSVPVPKNHNVIKSIKNIKLPKSASFIDLGGGTGAVTAGIKKSQPSWKATVLEPSKKAIKLGSKIFPWIDFVNGSLTQKKDMPKKTYDLVIISMVFSWIDRSLLSQAIANVDNLVKPKGYILIHDFYTPFPHANSYHHKEGLFTYKQDYALPFLSLNTYTEVCRNLGKDANSSFDKDDQYDATTMVAVLQKDLSNRYLRNCKQ
jgi:ubiquinone/menaquinone biosynthesis C-methylase UbiE